MDQIPLSATVDGVSAVCIRDGAFLLVERGREPSKGWLAFPGGRREEDETPQDAAIRELYEETGIVATGVSYLTTVTFDYSTPEFPSPKPFRLAVFLAHDPTGEAVAADDAAAVHWLRVDEMAAFDVTESVLEVAYDLASSFES
ncbi:NUDIX hydrolase [Phyllobacterium zundukense]|uniref:DNA mismatch repair protein MutT n=1 Tax=Phyllobacterium zundukense TaxID=1867719 RepID=A0A2N9W3L7_9HYPH|nr:NUDIX domain-containing protein [Phyllobacterium zundukense]ATU92186.1 DNA mismatch repair protein MutT [Phyllobacterium zundukense]PIO46335.1 DNA mismatch repair protein MutT [Phyllobacterium zundukense]